jgi:hypothetical protein
VDDDRIGGLGRFYRDMAQSVTVHTHQVAFLRFDPESAQGAREVPETEFLARPVTMMEFQRGEARCVAAVDASASEPGDQLDLPIESMPLLPSIGLRVPPAAPVLGEIRAADSTRWSL